MGKNWPARQQLNSERQQEQGDTNYRLLNIQTVSEAAEYPSRDDKQTQLAARQPTESQMADMWHKAQRCRDSVWDGEMRV